MELLRASSCLISPLSSQHPDWKGEKAEGPVQLSLRPSPPCHGIFSGWCAECLVGLPRLLFVQDEDTSPAEP